MKKIYSYDFNGKLIGETYPELCPVTEAARKEQAGRKLRPGEKEISKVFIFPAFSTEIEPPQASEGFEQKFDGSKWNLVKIEKQPETEKPKEPSAEYKEKIAKQEKALENLKKVNAKNLNIEEIRDVIADILTLIAPRE